MISELLLTICVLLIVIIVLLLCLIFMQGGKIQRDIRRIALCMRVKKLKGGLTNG